nr:integrin alpha [Acidobacteriota bacterium]
SLSREVDQANAQFGSALALAGDVDGDGYDDLLVGAPYYDGGQTDEGRAFLYRGGPDGLATTASWSAESNQANARFGLAVGRAGDVNGDGYADLVIGAPAYDNGQTDEGRVFVYHGAPSGPAGTAAFTFECDQSNAQCGYAVAGAGDVNGDGYADAVVGAPYYDNGQTDEGRAVVFHGSSTGLVAPAAWSAESNQANARFGWAVAGAGDVNRDGFSDVAAGAPYYDNGQTDEGRAYAFHGSAGGLATTASWTAESNQGGVSPAPAFGHAVAGAGDVNGDGYADLLVGAPYYDAGADNEGRVFLYYGGATGLAASAGWTTESEQNGGQLGYAVSSAGDVNGDGYADVAAGGNLFDGGSPKITSSGMVVVCRGSAAGPRPLEWDFFTWSDQSNARLGQALSGGGDLNGDGFGDFVAGAPLYDAGQSDEGRISFYRGGGWGSDSSLRMQQRRASDAAPIVPPGASDGASGFRLALSARSPFGPTRVALEWEVKPLGVPFDGTGLGRGAWVESWDDPTGRAALDELVTGLAAATPYHWRARMRYQSVTSPLQPHGRWMAIAAQGWQEAMLRTATATDGDGDGHFAGADCDDGNASVWAAPGEARELRLGPVSSALSWSAPLDPGGTVAALAYDTLRSGLASDFAGAASCVESDGGDTTSSDTAKPAAGACFFYLVRAQNACPAGQGPLGERSDGTPRAGRSCP